MKAPKLPRELRTVPAWCKVQIQVDDEGYYVQDGKDQYEVQLPSPPSYETAMLDVPFNTLCEDWLGKRVRVGATGAVAVVHSAGFPLRHWRKASSDGYQLVPGHLRLSELERFEDEPLTKLKKNMILDLDGKTSYETIDKLLDVVPERTKCYVHSSALLLYKDPTIEEKESESDSEADDSD